MHFQLCMGFLAKSIYQSLLVESPTNLESIKEKKAKIVVNNTPSNNTTVEVLVTETERTV